MHSNPRVSAFILSLPIIALSVTAAQSNAGVIVISSDGLRPDAIAAAGALHMQALIDRGSHHPAALCEWPPSTLPNHASMVTGLTIPHHGLVINDDLAGAIEKQTILDLATAAGLRCGFFASKEKLQYLARPGSAEAIVIDRDIPALTTALIDAILADPFDLTFIHFREPDSTGHSHGWMGEEYLDAVRQVDDQIGRLLDALASAELLDETDIILTADHGGEGKEHRANVAAIRLVPWIAAGPSFAPARRLCEPINQSDTAATALTVLGLPSPPDFDGQPVTEAFVATEQTPCESDVPTLRGPCLALPIAVASIIAVAMAGWRRADAANLRLNKNVSLRTP